MVTLINKIKCKYRMKLNFAQIMGARLCICEDRRVFSSKACMKLQCASSQICFSESKQYSLKVENIQVIWECLFFYSKSVKCCYISLYGPLVMQTLYITNVFFFLIEQYFIDALESILKLFHRFWNTLLYPKNIFYYAHTSAFQLVKQFYRPSQTWCKKWVEGFSSGL